MFINKKRKILILNITIICLFIYILLCSFYLNKNNINNNNDKLWLKTIEARDYIRYKCKDRRRIGGNLEHISNTNGNPLLRIDGAWFICFDKKISPRINDCNVLSFGINNDLTFDLEMNIKYGCNVFSFDPFVENDRSKRMRKNNSIYSYQVALNDKWFFYRIGLTDFEHRKNINKIGWMETFENIIKLLKLENKVIDILKMDIEGAEKQFLYHIDMNYACKYIKQFVLETHLNNRLDLKLYYRLKKLEHCFSLFHRYI